MDFKINSAILLAFALLLGVGCTEESTPKVVKKQIPPVKEQIIRWSHFNKRGFYNISFPRWFNAQKIKENNIKHIQLTKKTGQPDSDKTIFLDTFPDRRWNFYFNKKGNPQRVTFKEYVQSQVIAEHTFSYSSAPDEYGYSAPNYTASYAFEKQQSSIEQMINQFEEFQVFTRLELQEADSTRRIYRNTSAFREEKHIFIQDTNNWNVRHIDLTYQASGEDFFYYGTPKRFSTSFQLENLVEMTNDEIRTYYSTGALDQQHFYANGFYRKRIYDYDSLGNCTGYTDALITTAETPIFSERTKVVYDKDLPRALVTYAAEDTSLATPRQQMNIEYFKFSQP